MAVNEDRIYWNDSKQIVRDKLGLEYNEAFSIFENICFNIFTFRICLDPLLNWDKLERPSVTAAKNMVRTECRKREIELVDKEEDLSDLIEWKLYQLHKPVHARAVKTPTISVAAKWSVHTNQRPASSSNSESPKVFDPVRTAAKDAVRDTH